METVVTLKIDEHILSTLTVVSVDQNM